MKLSPWTVNGSGVTLTVERGGDPDLAAHRPLLLIHGSTTDASLWDDTRDALGQGRPLYLVNRRGRAGSGDAPGYDVAREGADLAAVLEAISSHHQDARVDVVAHSYGALCLLIALAEGKAPVERTVIYEPPLLPLALLPAPSFTAAMEDELRAGRPEEVVEGFFRAVEGLNDRQLAKLRSMPAWSMRVAAASTIPRELESVRHYRMPPGLEAWTRPVLFLVGGLSPPVMRRASAEVAARFPRTTTEVLPGQRHGAMTSAPALFVDAVLAFLSSPGD